MIALMLALSTVNAEYSSKKASAKGGQDFRKAAIKYDHHATKAAKHGKQGLAKKYRRLAEIKRNAASLADQGRWEELDWTEYFAINQQIKAIRTKHKQKHDK
jgi:hypothetical protein